MKLPQQSEFLPNYKTLFYNFYINWIFKVGDQVQTLVYKSQVMSQRKLYNFNFNS